MELVVFIKRWKLFGGKCVFASDIDADCRKTYEINYGIKPVGDITKVAAEDIPAHDVLCGGFPDNFKPDTKQPQAYKQFGNAVNVSLVKFFTQYMFGENPKLPKLF